MLTYNMKSMNWIRIPAIFLLGILIASCSNKAEKQSAQPESPGHDLVSVTREQMDAMGLEIGPISRQKLSKGIMVSGFLDTPPQHQAMVSSNISGKIVRINFLPGDYIRKGQEVIRLESMDFLKLQQDYIESENALKYLEDEYYRQKTLSENNVNAKKVFMQSERDYNSMKVKHNSLANQLNILGIKMEMLEGGDLTRFVPVISPINGYLTEIYAVIGEYIQNPDNLFRVVDPEELHAELNVYEKDIMKVREGQQVELTIPQIPDTVFLGEVFLIGKELDEKTRTVKIHVEIPQKKRLVSGMYVEGLVLTGTDSVLTVPSGALIREEYGSYIYVLQSQKDEIYNFRKIYVDTGSEKKGYTEIKLPADIDEASQVAISGVYYLSSG